jgi:hypothetical protein
MRHKEENMLIKIWTFAAVLALAMAPVTSLLAAGAGAAGGAGGSTPVGETGTGGTAAAGASTPSGKMDPGGATPSNKEADHSTEKKMSSDPAKK